MTLSKQAAPKQTKGILDSYRAKAETGIFLFGGWGDFFIYQSDLSGTDRGSRHSDLTRPSLEKQSSSNPWEPERWTKNLQKWPKLSLGPPKVKRDSELSPPPSGRILAVP